MNTSKKVYVYSIACGLLLLVVAVSPAKAQSNWEQSGNYLSPSNLNSSIGIGTTSPIHGKVQIESINVPLAFRETDQTGAGSLWRMPLDAKVLRFDASQNGTDFVPYVTALAMTPDGSVGIGKSPEGYKLDVNGRVMARGGYACSGLGDIAEKLATDPKCEKDSITPGTVVVVTKDGLVPCTQENDTCLAGVISTEPAVKMASDEKGQFVALAGKVTCKVTGKILAGDLLTTSSVEGHAQKADRPILCAIVGKALGDFKGESGTIDIWIGGL